MNKTPQWDQHAHRHSDIVDPVVTIQELSRFGTLRTTRVDHALVLTTAQGGLDTYLPPRRPSRTELATRRWTSVYEVDMGLHEAHAELALPSDDDAFLFDVGMKCSWQVVDPAAFVASGERDVPAMVRRAVEALVRPVLRSHPMAGSAVAEKAAQEALATAGDLGRAAGLWVRCGIQIRADEATLEQARQLREIAFARQKLEPRHALQLREDELAAERALAQVHQRHLVELENQNLAHERTLVGGRQALELQAVEAKKIEFYTYYLERGGPAAMAFHLSQHPEDARLVMEGLRQDQLQAMQNQLQVALQALGGGPGGLEEHQFDEPRRLAANVIREVLSARLAPGPGDGMLAVEAGQPAYPAPAAPVDQAGTAGEQRAAAAGEGGAAGGPGTEGEPPAPAAVFGYGIPTPPPAQ